MPVLVPHASLAALLGEDTVRSAAGTVGELLDEIERRVPAEDWRQASRATILVNGRNIHRLRGRQTRLESEDQVWMVLSGGGG
jgi:molybdopterin converting factor small subunit